MACFSAIGSYHRGIMKAAPNRTVVTGTLRHCTPAADGVGGEIEIEVTANESPEPNADFIRPEVGQALRAFCGQASDLADARRLIGRRVCVHLTFLGGPAGGRAVVQTLKPG
jgi:hypothetical protein